MRGERARGGKRVRAAAIINKKRKLESEPWE
jgi:hypothetical protein